MRVIGDLVTDSELESDHSSENDSNYDPNNPYEMSDDEPESID